MHVGHYISGAGHVGLIAWLLLGGLLTPARDPFEVTEVSVISGAEFEALMAAQRPPASVSEVAQPTPPETPAEAPEVTATPDEAVTQPSPLPTQRPANDPAPEVVEQALPPETQVEDTSPALEEPPGDVAVLVPEISPQAVPRPVERVAPQPVAQPEPDRRPDPVPQEAVSPEAEGETAETEQREATAPEEATTEIVTEAASAPRASLRPPGRRPAAPAPQTASAPAAAQPQQEEDVDAAAIAAAVAAAQSAATEAPAAAPSGPPLNAGEKEALRVAVSACWNVDVGGRSASTVVTVGVSLDRNGRVLGDVRLISSEGGDEAAVRTAFGAARRAILRCQKDGFPLPSEKYAQWQTIEMTFNPERMRVN